MLCKRCYKNSFVMKEGFLHYKTFKNMFNQQPSWSIRNFTSNQLSSKSTELFFIIYGLISSQPKISILGIESLISQNIRIIFFLENIKKSLYFRKWNFLALILKKFLYFLKRKLFLYLQKWNPALFSPSSKNNKSHLQKNYYISEKWKFLTSKSKNLLYFLKRRPSLFFGKQKFQKDSLCFRKQNFLIRRMNF